ncbi:Ankyrin repeat domain-containing protein 29, partial [Geodia barretti]
MRPFATEKDRLASQQQREIAELRSQLQTSQKPPVQRGREEMTVSRPKDEKALYDAARGGDVSAVRRLLASNVNINCTPYPDGWTPLMAASFDGHVEIVRLLIEAKAQLNIQEKETGATPLYIASGKGHSEVVDILLRNGAGVDRALNDGTTPLYIASQNGHSEVVDILLRNGAGVDRA